MKIVNVTNNDFSFKFKSIFPDYASFKSWLDNEQMITLSTIPETTYQYLFKVLFREYKNTDVMYYEVEQFQSDFANKIEDYIFKLNRTIELTKDIYELTEDEIKEGLSSIMNHAINPPQLNADDPTKPLNYIDDQTFALNKNPKLQAYLSYINNLPMLQNEAIINYFRNLFNNIEQDTIFVYND